MMAIISLITIILLSLIINRVATTALVHTGLSRASARFQARSAFTGAGFTTIEAESVVNHPVRRRIISHLMLIGNAGLVTSVTSLIFTFMGVQDSSILLERAGILAAAILALWLLAASRWVERRMSKIIEWALKRYTTLDVQDYTSLLHLKGDYKVFELEVEPEYWIAGMTLYESGLKSRGVQVLGVERGMGEYHGTPDGDFRILAGDNLVMYARTEMLEDLEWRKPGEREEAPPAEPETVSGRLDPSGAAEAPPEKEQES